MLKRYKNTFFEMIQTAGLDVTVFRAEDRGHAITGPTFVVSYKPAELTFVARNNPQNPHAFDYWY
jgi:hypothetical protein